MTLTRNEPLSNPRQAQSWPLIGQLEYWIACAAMLALVATVAVVFDALNRLALEVDNTDRLLTRQTAQAAITSVTSRLRDSHQDYAKWDDAVLNLYGVPERAFVEENMGGSTGTGILFDTAFLIDESGSDLAAFHDGAALTTSSRAYFGSALQRLIRQVEFDDASTHSGFAQTPDGIAAFAVGPVWPFTAEVKVPQGQRRLLVIARHLTAERLGKLRQEFVIPGLAVDLSAIPSPSGLPIVNPQGKPIAAMVWTVRSPGRAALAQINAKVWLTLGLLAASIGAIITVTWSNVRRTSLHKDAAEHAARHDFLTGLANRTALLEILEQERPASEGDDGNVAILYFDLDGFKNVNDTHGHDAGDRLLQQCAKKLVQLVAGRGLVARVGGDEFVVLVAGAESRTLADNISRAILEFFRAPIAVNGGTVQISTSIGAAHRLGREFSAMDLLKRADTAMYEAKRRGGNSVVCYDRGMEAATKLELAHVGHLQAERTPHLASWRIGRS